MSESELSTSEQSFSATDRPGRRLAEARKARGLSLEEMAAQLRLNVSTLQALEADDYSRLPPAAYVSGYLRSYARALGLSDAEANRGGTATAAASSEPPLVGVVARSHTAQVQANDPRVRVVTYLILGGLLLVSSAWWLTQREEAASFSTESAPVVTVPAVDTPASADGATGAPVVTPAPETAGLPSVAPTNIVTTVPAPVVAAPTAAKPVAPAPAIAPAQVAAIKPAPAAAPAPVATAPAGTTAPVTEVPPKPVLPPPPPLTPDTPQSTIALEFSADCWVDVIDAAGRQLVYELALPGRTMRLRGEAPFKVFFGYSPGVQVTFNDQAFDHTPYQRRDMARFKLGTAEDNALPTDAQ